MRIMMAAAILIAGSCSAAAIAGELPSQCSDRNALNGMSVDARLVAIRYYFVGLVRASTDRSREACYEAHALNDAGREVLNKTLELIETNCSTMENAARTAIEPACP
jgi:hypothetical protein